ncbi:autotransporter outer membrane beta-barrel domain-containing protein, partial [Pseudomonas viridiflava]|uniref:autotransporter outer membrane beta-barrel domain-containing protein n=1 Tax=Pseudomonas viridiflava TaxID=33069 RepID=UPI000F07C5F8
TWLDSQSGYCLDGVIKLNRFNNKARVNLSDGTRTKGDYSNSGVGASVEFGRHIKLDGSYYVEPYTQLIGAFIEGKDYELDNGLRAEGDSTRSLLG